MWPFSPSNNSSCFFFFFGFNTTPPSSPAVASILVLSYVLCVCVCREGTELEENGQTAGAKDRRKIRKLKRKRRKCLCLLTCLCHNYLGTFPSLCPYIFSLILLYFARIHTVVWKDEERDRSLFFVLFCHTPQLKMCIFIAAVAVAMDDTCGNAWYVYKMHSLEMGIVASSAVANHDVMASMRKASPFLSLFSSILFLYPIYLL